MGNKTSVNTCHSCTNIAEKEYLNKAQHASLESEGDMIIDLIEVWVKPLQNTFAVLWLFD